VSSGAFIFPLIFTNIAGKPNALSCHLPSLRLRSLLR